MVHVDRALTHYLLQRVLQGLPVELTEFHSEGVHREVAQEQGRMGQWFSRKFKTPGMNRFTDHAAPEVAETVHRTFVGVVALEQEAMDLEECAAGRSDKLVRARELRAWARAWRDLLDVVVADHELDLRRATRGAHPESAWLIQEKGLRQVVERPTGPEAQRLLTVTRNVLTAIETADAEVGEVAEDL